MIAALAYHKGLDPQGLMEVPDPVLDEMVRLFKRELEGIEEEQRRQAQETSLASLRNRPVR